MFCFADKTTLSQKVSQNNAVSAKHIVQNCEFAAAQRKERTAQIFRGSNITSQVARGVASVANN